MSQAQAPEVVSVGIDVSKQKLDVALLFADQTSKSSEFSNTREGVRKLVAALKKQRTAATVPCVVESTGDYHLLTALRLTRAGYTVNCINPIITKQYQRSSIRNAKTDTIDALRLARIGLQETNLPRFSAEPSAILVKKAISYLATLEKTRQRLNASRKQLVEAGELLGGTLDLAATDAALSALKRQIEELREFVRTNVPDQEAVKDLGTIKGVSEEQIAMVFGMLSGASFANRDQIVAFAGLDVMPRQSGMWQGRGRLSKRGNPYLRKVLYQMAWSLKQHNEQYQAYYHRLRVEHEKHYTTCIVAIARKFLRFLYAYHWKEPQLSPALLA